MDKDDAFFHRLTSHQKEQYRNLIEKYKQIHKPEYLERINAGISTDSEHLEMVQACSRAFCGTELSQISGFQFFCAEPLVEFGGLKKGNKSFDLLLYNEQSKKAIFIECKSSIKKDIKPLISEIDQSFQLVQENKDYLSERIDNQIAWDDCEYILCVADKDSQKIKQSNLDQSSTNRKNTFNVKGFVNWIYYPYSGIIQVSDSFPHSDPEFNGMMQIGTEKKLRNPRLDIPYCITSHPFIIIEQAIIGLCYANQYAKRNSLTDSKIITKNRLMNEMMRTISLVVSDTVKKEMVKEKLEKVIEYGLKYDLLIKVDEESFRINCRGERPATVIDAIREKFIENWAVYNATIDGQKSAELEMQKKISQKEISDF